MTIKPLVILPDPVLRQVSKPVERVDDALRKLADDMLETMYDAPGIGLAATQVEVLGRLPEYRTGTGFVVTPVVGLVTPPLALRPVPIAQIGS